MTEIIRQSLHQAITERNAKILYRGTGVESYNDPHTMGLVEVAPWTLRWTKRDSNFWSHLQRPRLCSIKKDASDPMALRE
jgi:hypothetical protein